MYGSHDIRHIGFSQVDGGQRDPREMGRHINHHVLKVRDIEKKDKGIETNKILLEDLLSLWMQVSNNKFLFFRKCEYHEIKDPVFWLFMNKL